MSGVTKYVEWEKRRTESHRGLPSKAFCNCYSCWEFQRMIVSGFLYNWGEILTPGFVESIHTPFSSPSRIAA